MNTEASTINAAPYISDIASEATYCATKKRLLLNELVKKERTKPLSRRPARYSPKPKRDVVMEIYERQSPI